MAARKTKTTATPKSTTKPTAEKTAKPVAPKKTATPKAKPAKIPFYAKAGRLFAASAGRELPRGSYARPTTDLPDGALDQLFRVGTEKVCVFQGSLRDLLETALLRGGIKLKLTGAAIAAPVEKASPAV